MTERMDEPRAIRWKVPGTKPLEGPDGALENLRIVIEVPEVVREAVYAAREAQNVAIGARAASETIDGHIVFSTEKTAAILALLDGRTRMNEGDWELVTVLMRKSLATRDEAKAVLAKEAKKDADKKAERHGRTAAISEDARDNAAIVSVMASLRSKVSGEWINGSDLRKSLRSNRREFFNDAIERLIASGEVEAETTASNGSTGTRYRAAA